MRKKATMDRKKEDSPTLAEIMEAISEIATQNKSFNKTLNSISTRMDMLSGITEEVKQIKNRVEIIEKKIVRKTVVIHGLADSRQETMEQTEQIVSELATKLGLIHLDVDVAMRMGKYQEGKVRPVELTLVRQKQTTQLMKSKWKLKENEDTRTVYIDEVCTPDDLRKRSNLLKFAKLQKSVNNASSYRLIAKNMLEVHGGRTPGKFHVNEEGQIVAWTEKTAEGSLSRLPRTEGDQGYSKGGKKTHT